MNNQYDYAYVEYTNGGYIKCDVYIQFSADSILDYLALKKEKKVKPEDIIGHSFKVIQYMDSLGYSLIGLTQKIDSKALDSDLYRLLLLFRKEKISLNH